MIRESFVPHYVKCLSESLLHTKPRACLIDAPCLAVAKAREPKIRHLRRAISVEQDVGRFDVAVDNILAARACKFVTRYEGFLRSTTACSFGCIFTYNSPHDLLSGHAEETSHAGSRVWR